MSGPKIDAFAVVRLIQQLLGDRYRWSGNGIPVVKELLQNADDAHAAAVDFVRLETGIETARHPLLRGAAFVAINDGPFTAENAKGILSLTDTTKGSAVDAIGRFGIGQKSVFQICEAFFFVGQDTNGDLHFDVLDPWDDGVDHSLPVWPAFAEEDRERVTAEIQQLLPAKKGWFVLWLPLREESHRPAGTFITKFLPQTRDLEFDPAQVARVAPTLAWVSRIRSWRRASGSALRAEWELEADGERLSRPRAESQQRTRALHGTVRLGGTDLLSFKGQERLVEGTAFSDLQASARWPERFDRGPDGSPRVVKEKAIAHGGVVVTSEHSTPQSDLTIEWAVFLPIGPEGGERLRIGHGERSWNLLLHGYFFPDSGRRGIAGLDHTPGAAPAQSQEDLCRDWNAMLRDAATLPCILPAVSDAFSEEGITDTERYGFCAAFEQTALYRRHRAVICRQHQLLCAVSPERDDWRLVDSGTRVLGLPSQHPRPSAPFLQAISPLRAGGVELTWIDHPRLAASDALPAWTLDELRVVLSPEAEVAGQTTDLGFIAQLVRRVVAPSNPDLEEIQIAVREFVRVALRRRGTSALAAQGSAWSSLVDSCRAKDLLFSPASPLLQSLAGVPGIDVLVLPDSLRPPDWDGKPEISRGDCLLILRELDQHVASAGTDAAGRVAAAVVAGYGPSRLAEDSELANFRVFRVWSGRQRASISISAAQLLALSTGGAAAVEAGIYQPQGAVAALSAAVVDQSFDFVLTGHETGAALGIPPLSGRMLLGVIATGTRALVEDASIRSQALEGIVRGDQRLQITDAVVRLGIRALVHGDASRAASDETLFIPSPDISHELAAHVLAALDLSWRLVPLQFLRALNVGWLQALGLEPISRVHVVAALAAASTAQLARLTTLSDPERVELLRMVDGSRDVFRTLPLHRTSSTALVPISERTFLDAGTWPIPVRLEDRITRIVRDAEISAQERWIPRWSPASQIAVALSQADANEFRAEILDALRETGGRGLPDQLRDTLRRTRWLSTTSGLPVAPTDLLNASNEVVAAAVAILSSTTSSGVMVQASVAEDIREHAAFGPVVMEQLALQGAEVVSRLVASIAALPEEQLRMLRIATDIATVPRFTGEPMALTADPAWRLVFAARAAFENDPARVTPIIEVLCGRLADERFVWLLHAVAGGDHGSHRGVFDAYLRMAAATEEFVPAILPQIRLQTRSGSWRSANELSRPLHNVAASFQVAEDHWAIVSNSHAADGGGPLGAVQHAMPDSDPPTSQNLMASAAVLRTYFQPWREPLGDDPIGLLVCLLGDGADNSVRHFAETLLACHDAETERNRLLFECSAPAMGVADVIASRLPRLRYAIRTAQTDGRISTVSLTGQVIEVPISDAIEETIFVGDVRPADEPRWLTLRRPPDDADPNALRELLWRSIERFMRVALRRDLRPEALQARFGAAAEGGLQVEAVHERILSELPAHLRYLGCSDNPQLREAVRSWDQAVSRRSTTPDFGTNRARADEAVRAAFARFRELLESDLNIQRFVRRRVAQKVSQLRYRPDQVLFELFQNADDAATQLVEMLDDGGDETLDDLPRVRHAREFRVELSGRSLCIVHWGRGINEHDVGSQFRDGLLRGYDLDLLHMMLIGESDKIAEAGDPARNTGRFGLGFKSVHLVSDRPRVMSRHLSFEILAGLLPVRIQPPDAWSAWRESGGTVIELPLLDEIDSATIGQFSEFGGLLAAFAQTIRRVSLRQEGRESTSEWCGASMDGVRHASVALLRTGVGRANQVPTRVLKISGTGRGPQPAIAIAVADGAAVRLPRSIPSVWVTAPTGECWDLGFCANGPFVLDAGRAQIDIRAPENRHVVAELGRILGESLASLAEQFESPLVRSVLFENQTPSAARFWTSLWNVMTDGLAALPGERGELLRSLHGYASGIGPLIRLHPTIPSDLPGAYACLLKWAAVRFVADDGLARVIGHLEDTSWIQAILRPGEVVSERVGAALSAFDLRQPSVHDFRVADLLRRWSEINGNRVEPGQAEDLFDLVSLSRQMNDIEGVVSAWARCLRFQCADGDWREPVQLLVPPGARQHLEEIGTLGIDRDLSEEALRSEFAPPSFRLNDAYAHSAEMIGFFVEARGPLAVGRVEQLAQWMRLATNPAQQQAALRYLVDGERGDLVGRLLREERPIWIPEREALLRNWAPIAHWSDADRVTLALRLFQTTGNELLQGWHVVAGETEGVPIAPTVQVPPNVIEEIATWWDEEHVARTRAYEERAYPSPWNGERFVAALRAQGDERREAWMTLLTLGACHSFGRQVVQQHRGFIEACRSRGQPRWWDVFHEANHDPVRWVRVLDERDAVDQETYSHWFRLFPDLYRFSRFLEVYRRCFLAARTVQPFNLESLISPRTNSAFQGSDLLAPSLRSSLGIGAVWVLRELMRFGVIDGPALPPSCYVPHDSTFRLLEALGGPPPGDDVPSIRSRQIHRFLVEHLGQERALFRRSFDLPLHLVMSDPELRQRFGIEGFGA